MTVSEASVVGLFKMVFIIIGVLVVLRFVGRLNVAKRNLAEEQRMKDTQNRFNKEKKKKTKESLGKTSVLGKKQNDSNDIQDVDFEEVD